MPTSYASSGRAPGSTPARLRERTAELLGRLDRALTLPALLLLAAYRVAVSPLLAPACRFEPSCSAYAAGALRRFGLARGGAMALRRLASCHPWNPGGYDPVPPDGAPGLPRPGATPKGGDRRG